MPELSGTDARLAAGVIVNYKVQNGHIYTAQVNAEWDALVGRLRDYADGRPD